MKLSEYNGLVFVTSELFDSYGIKHMFSTVRDKERNLNKVSFSVRGSYAEGEVKESYSKVAQYFNVLKENITKSTQIHEDNILILENRHIGMGVTKQSDIKNADGLATDKKNIPLCIFSADCVPVLFADKNKKAVIAVHAGWKGTAKEITKKAFTIMTDTFGIDKKDILCAIGPAIDKCCFEVSDDVIESMAHIPDISLCYEKKKNGKYQLDLKKVNKQILLSCGADKNNIDVIPLCTKCEDELFHSYRREGEKAGRNAAFIIAD